MLFSLTVQTISSNKIMQFSPKVDKSQYFQNEFLHEKCIFLKDLQIRKTQNKNLETEKKKWSHLKHQKKEEKRTIKYMSF